MFFLFICWFVLRGFCCCFVWVVVVVVGVSFVVWGFSEGICVCSIIEMVQLNLVCSITHYCNSRYIQFMLWTLANTT